MAGYREKVYWEIVSLVENSTIASLTSRRLATSNKAAQSMHPGYDDPGYTVYLDVNKGKRYVCSCEDGWMKVSASLSQFKC
ncbi:hypothetical protein PAAG_07177 [Paracoccidioides lutzii Pb01]|uniref:Uncharacterized protein n=1 Tax=Paracoccidioides lutzii (strain ATCC MYA-826 / Pb01) TaxID=502779 RepID=C1H8T6_PARBA|nr:hypothetical protein PAAG_07177 [Paracoccidioides lutzii Pb01]EEH36759.2 hypothetical protein PAAG_07177 [Paracoccidioides lutzii Pb01]